MIYGKRRSGENHGFVLTKPRIVNAILDRVGYDSDSDLQNVKIIEPSAGEGAFALEIIKRLKASAEKFKFSFQSALDNVCFCELDPGISKILCENISSLFHNYKEEVPSHLVSVGDYLLMDHGSYDIVIGNPPYVRHENIPNERKKLYKSIYSTFRYRSDLYIPFFQKSLELLRSGGKVAFICSNRWLKNQYGGPLRRFINDNKFSVEVIDLDGINAFTEKVTAYPSIIILSESENKLKAQEKSVYFSIKSLRELSDSKDSKIIKRNLNIGYPSNWFIDNVDSNSGGKNYYSINEQGFKIGIGVATGLDRVFIGPHLPSLIEAELIVPVLLARDLKGDNFNWGGNYLFNPFTLTGSLVDLNHFPKAKRYLNSHKDSLLSRHISRKNEDNWYRTIDKIKINLLKVNKILLPDISGNSHIFIDRGNYYPHHNLYFIYGRELSKLELLSAFLCSQFVRNQLYDFGNLMNGGYLRWQSQTLKKLRLPLLDIIPFPVERKIIQAYRDKDYLEIDSLVGNLLKMPEINIPLQPKLFNF